MKKNVLVLGVVILGLCSIGISGAFDLVEVTVPSISIDVNGTGAANASICVANHSRLVYIWCDENCGKDTIVTLGKDGQYIEFAGDERGYLVVGISPRWNQTVEIYISSNSSVPFDILGTVVAGSVWRNNGWEIDNPEQLDRDVVLATVVPFVQEVKEDV